MSTKLYKIQLAGRDITLIVAALSRMGTAEAHALVERILEGAMGK